MPAAESLRLMISRQHAKYNRNARGVLSRQRFNRTGSGVAIEQGGGETLGQFGEGCQCCVWLSQERLLHLPELAFKQEHMILSRQVLP
jgi:hypothetical protein